MREAGTRLISFTGFLDYFVYALIYWYPCAELCLRDFENEIYKEHTPMMVGIDALKTIYSQNNPIFSTLRNIGTATINSNQAAKELFISRAA